eukprot:6205312-Pleurochrysis_carterae.AAC.1
MARSAAQMAASSGLADKWVGAWGRVRVTDASDTCERLECKKLCWDEPEALEPIELCPTDELIDAASDDSKSGSRV